MNQPNPAPPTATLPAGRPGRGDSRDIEALGALGEPGTIERPATSPGGETREETLQSPADETTGAYRVILYNDDWHSVDEVILQVQKATGCDIFEATEIMLEAHIKGRAICYRGEREECHRVARVLREIRLQVEVDGD